MRKSNCGIAVFFPQTKYYIILRRSVCPIHTRIHHTVSKRTHNNNNNKNITIIMICIGIHIIIIIIIFTMNYDIARKYSCSIIIIK